MCFVTAGIFLLLVGLSSGQVGNKKNKRITSDMEVHDIASIEDGDEKTLYRNISISQIVFAAVALILSIVTAFMLKEHEGKFEKNVMWASGGIAAIIYLVFVIGSTISTQSV